MRTIVDVKQIKDEAVIERFRKACKDHKYFVATIKESFEWDQEFTLKEIRRFVLQLGGELNIYDKEFDTLYHFYRKD